MAAVKIQDLSPEVIAALERRAARHERSLENELRDVLIHLAIAEPPIPPLPPIELKLASGWGTGDWRREEIYGDNGR